MRSRSLATVFALGALVSCSSEVAHTPADAALDGPREGGPGLEAGVPPDGGAPPDGGVSPDATAPQDAAATDAAPTDGAPTDAGTTDVGPGPDAGTCTINFFASPSACGYPDETNTGVPAGVQLTASGPIRVDDDGTVIDGVDVTGDIDIYARDVTVRNCRVTVSDAYWGIMIRDTGVTVTDCEINGSGSSGQGILDVGGGLVAAQRNNIYGFADGIMSEVGLLEANYVHDLEGGPGAHHDGIQNGGGGPQIIRHNTVVNPHDETSAIALFQDFGAPAHDVTVEDNLLAGGGYTVYGGDGDLETSNLHFVGNRFGRVVWPNSGYWGPVAYWAAGEPGNVWSDNVWDDTNEPVVP